jgi:hypothetical protein
VTPYGDFSRIREYFVQKEENSNDTADITAHVPRYIPANLSKLVGNSNEDVLFALSDDFPNRIYVYKFFWTEDGKTQSAWNFWELSAEAVILEAAALEHQLYILVERTDGVYIEVADLQSSVTTGEIGFQVLLDRRHKNLTAIYDPAFDRTEINLQYPIATAQKPDFRLVYGNNFPNGGALVNPSTYQWLGTKKIAVPGNQTEGSFHTGMIYTATHTFSELFPKSGDQSILTGEMVMRNMTIFHQDTGYYRAEVFPYGEDPLAVAQSPTIQSEFTAWEIGSPLKVGEDVFDTGSFTFSVPGNSKSVVVKLVNDSHVQSRWQSAEYEAIFQNRATVR